MSEKEIINIFNSEYELIGTATREEAHKKGLWHETFHCWMYDIKDKEVFLYFQQRAAEKKDFPNQLDITAAGHLLADETVYDGFREVTEELGIELSPNSADCLGVFPVQIHLKDFFDNEFTNVFVANKELELGTFSLQEEEVSAIYAIPLKKLKELFSGKRKRLDIKGIFQENKKQIEGQRTIALQDICAHSHSYYADLFDSLEKILENQVRSID